MKQFLQNLISSDDTQVSTLHCCLIFIVTASVIPLFILSYKAAVTTDSIATIATAMGSFMKDYGIGLGSVHAGVGALWWAKKG